MITNDNKKTPKNPKKFYCKKCDFVSSNKKDYSRHLLTRKHKKPQKTPKNPNFVEFKCEFCNKIYKFKSGLSRHRKKCKSDPENLVDSRITRITLSDSAKAETENIKKTVENTWKELFMQQIKNQNLDVVSLIRYSYIYF